MKEYFVMILPRVALVSFFFSVLWLWAAIFLFCDKRRAAAIAFFVAFLLCLVIAVAFSDPAANAKLFSAL